MYNTICTPIIIAFSNDTLITDYQVDGDYDISSRKKTRGRNKLTAANFVIFYQYEVSLFIYLYICLSI